MDNKDILSRKQTINDNYTLGGFVNGASVTITGESTLDAVETGSLVEASALGIVTISEGESFFSMSFFTGNSLLPFSSSTFTFPNSLEFGKDMIYNISKKQIPDTIIQE